MKYDMSGVVWCGGASLAEEQACALLGQLAVALDVLVEVATGAELEDEIERLVGVDDLEQLDDVRVVDQLHHADLQRSGNTRTASPRLVVDVVQLVLVELHLVNDLDGDLLLREHVLRPLHHRKVPLRRSAGSNAWRHTPCRGSRGSRTCARTVAPPCCARILIIERPDLSVVRWGGNKPTAHSIWFRQLLRRAKRLQCKPPTQCHTMQYLMI